MDWDDFKSLISKLERDGEYKFCLLISIGVFTGLRISDLLQLNFSQFETGNEVLTFTEQKTKKHRRIKINPDLREIVERVRVEVTPSSSGEVGAPPGRRRRRPRRLPVLCPR